MVTRLVDVGQKRRHDTAVEWLLPGKAGGFAASGNWHGERHPGTPRPSAGHKLWPQNGGMNDRRMTAAVLYRHGGPEALEIRADWPVPRMGRDRCSCAWGRRQ